MTENCLITGGPANHPEIGDQEPCSCVVCRMDRELQFERQESDEMATDLVEALKAHDKLKKEIRRQAKHWRKQREPFTNKCAAEIERIVDQSIESEKG